MYNPEKLTNEQSRKVLAEELWLSYFNRFLFEKGRITVSERNRMVHLIANRSSGVEKQKYRTKVKQRKGKLT